MIAYRYIDGALEEVDWTDEVVRVGLPAAPLRLAAVRSRRERRALARRWPDGSPRGRGRRGAIPVGRRAWDDRSAETQVETLRAHQIHDGRGGRVLLYLPAGIKVTENHLRDIGLASRGVTPNEARLMREFGCSPWDGREVLRALDGDIEMARIALRLSAHDGRHPCEAAMLVRWMSAKQAPCAGPLPLPG